MAIFAVLAGSYTARLLLDMYVTQRFIMRWRIWLSHRFIDDWLGDLAYFRAQFSGRPIDNPDQRIQQDIDVFTTGVGGETNNPIYNSGDTLLFGAVEAVLSVLSFGPILWRLSGPVTIGGLTLERALFWIVLVYVLVATIIAFVIGRPLIRLSYLNELRNAGFRYALVRVRDAGAAIGLYRGEPAERSLLKGRLASVMDNYRGWLRRTMLFFGWNVTMSQAINPLPWLVQAKRCSRSASRSAMCSSPPTPSPRSMTRCRSSVTPTTSSRATARRSSVSTGWPTRMRGPEPSPRCAPTNPTTARSTWTAWRCADRTGPRWSTPSMSARSPARRC